MTKNEYLFRVFDEENNKTCLKREFTNLTIKEATNKAENILKDSKKVDFHKKLDISLTLIESSIGITEEIKTHKMQWNEAPFSKGKGYFNGWESTHSEASDSKATSFKNTYLLPILIAIIAIVSLQFTVKTANYEKTAQILLIGIVIYLASLLYSCFHTIVKSNFMDKAKSIKDLIFYNVILEIPIWLTTIIALYKLSGDIEIVIPNPIGLYVWIGILLLTKLSINILFDKPKIKK